MPANDRLLLGKAGMAAMGGQIQPSSARKKIGMVFHVEHFVVTEVYLHIAFAGNQSRGTRARW